MFPSSPKLTPLLREAQFLVALLTGLPGIVLGYVLAIQAGIDVWHGELALEDVGLRLAGIAALLTANPITAYLAARQYARGKAAEAVGVQLAPLPAPADPGDLGVTDADVMAAQVLHAVDQADSRGVSLEGANMAEPAAPVVVEQRIQLDGKAIHDAILPRLSDDDGEDTQPEEPEPAGPCGAVSPGGTVCIGVKGHTVPHSDGRPGYGWLD